MKHQRVLLLGGSGQIGLSLQTTAPDNVELLSPSSRALDIAAPQALLAALETFRPDVVINSAAYTAVERAEDDQLLAYRCNAQAVGLIAHYCGKHKIPLLHLSTDYVFSGQSQHPYKETDPPQPLNFYGWSKWAGEQQLWEKCENAFVIRISGVFSAVRNNFVKTMIKKMGEHQALRVVSDQITRPTSADTIAETIWALLRIHPPYGTYHYASHEAVTWYAFACSILELCRQYFPSKQHHHSCVFRRLSERVKRPQKCCPRLRKNSKSLRNSASFLASRAPFDRRKTYR